MSLLEVEGLTKRFGGLTAVDHLTFTIEEGEWVGLIGPNGSGKSTLFSLLSGVERPDGGQIRFDGHSLVGLSPAQIYRLGLVRGFQVPRLFAGMDVLENMLVAEKDHPGEGLAAALTSRRFAEAERLAGRRAARWLQSFGLADVTHQLAPEISGGQMKLLEAARTLMSDPRLLLLDEPAAGVAPALAQEIFQRLSLLRQEEGITMLIIEHRLHLLFDHVDRVLVLHQGRLLAEGPPEQVAEDPRVIEAYFGNSRWDRRQEGARP